MRWVTRTHVHIDRVACPWLITRFIDSEAEFLFVAKNQIQETSQLEQAIPFDAPNVELGHHGEKCTFESLIDKYELTDKALLRMAKIINAADTNRLDKDPLAAGLEAIAVGFSIRFPDDKENLPHQFDIYDALYAWCRLDAAKAK